LKVFREEGTSGESRQLSAISFREEKPKNEEKKVGGVGSEEPTLSAKGAERVGHPQDLLSGVVTSRRRWHESQRYKSKRTPRPTLGNRGWGTLRVLEWALKISWVDTSEREKRDPSLRSG